MRTRTQPRVEQGTVFPLWPHGDDAASCVHCCPIFALLPHVCISCISARQEGAGRWVPSCPLPLCAGCCAIWLLAWVTLLWLEQGNH